jgi:hypothetical protein
MAIPMTINAPPKICAKLRTLPKIMKAKSAAMSGSTAAVIIAALAVRWVSPQL